jgi:hypothetical protein
MPSVLENYAAPEVVACPPPGEEEPDLGPSCGAAYTYSSHSPKWTFQSQQIHLIVQEVLNATNPATVLVPFAGTTRLQPRLPPMEVTYIDPHLNAKPDGHHIRAFAEDALEAILQEVQAGSRPPFDLIISDPPWSAYQVVHTYQSGRQLPLTWLKDRFAQALAPAGSVLSFAWNSTGMGARRGFRKAKIWLVNNGGNRHDTIITWERRDGP